MKKKLILTALIAAMAVSATAAAVYAETDGAGEAPEPDTGMIMPAPQGIPAYARHDAVIAEVTDSSISLDIGGELPETATISEDTVILTAAGEVADLSALKAGANVSVFVDGNAPVTLQYPARYPASYIVIGDEIGFAGVDIDVYAESDSLGMYLNGAKTLAINVGEDTEIVTVTGSRIKIDYTDLANRKLAVFYNMMTMSLPPITNPTRVVVLDDAGGGAVPPSTEPSETLPDEAPEYAYEFTADGADVYTDENGVKMLPVRKYAESLGLEVAWDGELRAVTVGTIPMGVNFRIGENAYAKARMTPFTLEAAPRLVGDTTYVPVSFFEQVLEAKVEILNACPPEAIDASLTVSPLMEVTI